MKFNVLNKVTKNQASIEIKVPSCPLSSSVGDLIIVGVNPSGVSRPVGKNIIINRKL